MCSGESARAQALLDQLIGANIPGTGLDPGVTVLSRQRPEYDSLGVRLGEITIRGDFQELAGYESNVLATTKPQGSATFESTAQVQAAYDHSDTTGLASISVDDYEYPQQSQQSFTNWTASLGGTHDFGRDTLSVNYDHLNLNQTVGGLDEPAQLNQALPYQIDAVRLGYRATFARTFVLPALIVSNYNFTSGTVAGTPFPQGYRDRVVVQPSVTLGYELSPRRDLVLVVRDSIAQYRNQLAGQPARNFNDVQILAGLSFETGPLLRFRLLGGYEQRQFSSASLKTISAPIVEAQAVWNTTSLTTLTATAFRHVQDSASENTVAFTETALGGRLDYEFRRNILLQANGFFYRDDYGQGQGHQELYTAETGATWFLNRHLRLGALYDFSYRLSSGAANLGITPGQVFGNSYTDSRYLLQLRLAL